MDINIEHQPDQHRFISVVDGFKCYLTYRITDNPLVWDFNHAYTAPEVRGRQIAEQITRFAMEYARANGIKVIPGCPYVVYFVATYPEYGDVLA